MPLAGDPHGSDRDRGNATTGSTSGNNPFIRFKDHVDNSIQRGYEIWSSFLWTLPSTLDSLSRSRKDAQISSSSTSPAVLSRDATTTTPPSTSSSPALIYPRSQHDANGDDVDGITDVDGVYKWAVHSPYSPLNLQHLRQPVPRDAPRHYYHHFSFTFPPWSSTSSSSSNSSSSSSSSDPRFTFRDAFEDLLFVSAGYPLPDLNGRLFGRAFEEFPRWGSFGFRSELGLHVAEWTTKLGYLGLWHSYFPRLAVPVPERHDWGLELPFSPWFAARRRWLAADAENATADDEGASSRLRFKPASGGGTFGGWDKVWDWAWSEKESVEWPKELFGDDEASKTRDDRRNDTTTSPPPSEVEEDLYNALAASDFQVVASEDQQQQQPKAITTATNTSEKALADNRQQEEQPTNSETIETETVENPDGGKTVRTVRRQEDKANGRTEVATTTERYDAEGNLVSRSSSTKSTRKWSSSTSSSTSSSFSSSYNEPSDGRLSFSSAPSSAWTWADSSGREGDEKRESAENDDRKKGKSGWFWTK